MSELCSEVETKSENFPAWKLKKKFIFSLRCKKIVFCTKSEAFSVGKIFFVFIFSPARKKVGGKLQRSCGKIQKTAFLRNAICFWRMNKSKKRKNFVHHMIHMSLIIVILIQPSNRIERFSKQNFHFKRNQSRKSRFFCCCKFTAEPSEIRIKFSFLTKFTEKRIFGSHFPLSVFDSRRASGKKILKVKICRFRRKLFPFNDGVHWEYRTWICANGITSSCSHVGMNILHH